jgi:hypothetical protein
MNESHMHLKICEGCGRLWLRSMEMSGVYCLRCSVHLAQFPSPHKIRKAGRPHKASRRCMQQALESVGGGE